MVPFNLGQLAHNILVKMLMASSKAQNYFPSKLCAIEVHTKFVMAHSLVSHVC